MEVLKDNWHSHFAIRLRSWAGQDEKNGQYTFDILITKEKGPTAFRIDLLYERNQLGALTANNTCIDTAMKILAEFQALNETYKIAAEKWAISQNNRTLAYDYKRAFKAVVTLSMSYGYQPDFRHSTLRDFCRHPPDIDDFSGFSDWDWLE